MTEEQRAAIVNSGPVYLADGLRASLAGWKIEAYCTVSSPRPGLWACTWETAAAVVARPDRRFLPTDDLRQIGHGWLGVTPRPEDYQTPADYEQARSAEQAV